MKKELRERLETIRDRMIDKLHHYAAMQTLAGSSVDLPIAQAAAKHAKTLSIIMDLLGDRHNHLTSVS